MKQNFLLLAVVILMTAFTQGWASTIDSLRIHQNSDDFTCTWNGFGLRDSLKYTDGLIPDDRLPNDNLSVIDFITPSGTAETNASNSTIMSRTIYISRPENGKVTFSDVTVGTSKQDVFVIVSNYIKKYSLEIVDVNNDNAKKMFELSAYSLNAGMSVGVSRGVYITYKPTAAGTHKVKVIIRETGNWLGLVGGAKTCTLTVEGKAVLPTPTVSVNPTQLNFDKADTKSFKVKGTNILSNLTLQKRGTGARYFTLSKTTIGIIDANRGVYVNVTCNPTTSLQQAVAYVDIIYNNKVLATVKLIYAKNQMPMVGLIEPETENGEFKNNEPDETSISAWDAATTDVDELALDVKIYTDGQSIVIESPVAQSAIVSDIAGHAQSVNLQEGRNVIPASGNGIHIVKVGEKTVKLLLR